MKQFMPGYFHVMNRFEGAFGYLQLSVLILFLSGCSYLPSENGIFAGEQEGVTKSETDQPKRAAAGGAKHEPETAAELDLPKPKWKPDVIPDVPERLPGLNDEVSGAIPIESINQTTLIENPDVQQLLGMSFLQVKEKLGQPGWIRDVYPARVWGYDIESCSLQVFFYPKLDQAGDYRVLAYESGLQGEANDTETMLKDKEKPSGTVSEEVEAGDAAKLEQTIIQACFEKLLGDSTSVKTVVPNNISP